MAAPITYSIFFISNAREFPYSLIASAKSFVLLEKSEYEPVGDSRY